MQTVYKEKLTPATSKARLAYNSIKDMIIDGSITSQTALTESAISELLGISRTPVRSALIELENDGLIRIIPNQGIILRELTVREAKDYCELRMLTETRLINESIEKLGEEDFRQIEAVLREQKICMEKKAYKEYLELDDKFHQICYQHAMNQAIIDVWTHSKNILFKLRLQSIRSSDRLVKSYEEHEEFYRVLRSGNLEQARNQLMDHVSKGILSII